MLEPDVPRWFVSRVDPEVRERPILFSGPLVLKIRRDLKWQTRRVARSFRIHLPRAVRSDLGFLGPEHHIVARPGIHRARLNQHGAVSVELPGGKLLGVKPHEFEFVSPYGAPGDRLWVRETWARGNPLSDGSPSCQVAYRADGRWGSWGGDGDGGRLFLSHGWVVGHAPDARARDERGNWVGFGAFGDRWRPSIFMPRWASRTLLEVTEVRIERLQAITEADARAEGVEPYESEPTWKVLRPDGSAYDCYVEPEADDPEVHSYVENAPFRESARDRFRGLWDGINAKRGFGWGMNPWVYAVSFKRLVPR